MDVVGQRQGADNPAKFKFIKAPFDKQFERHPGITQRGFNNACLLNVGRVGQIGCSFAGFRSWYRSSFNLRKYTNSKI